MRYIRTIQPFCTMEDKKGIIATLRAYCDRLNAHMPCKSQEDVDALAEIMSELFGKVKGSHLYWSREIFLDCGSDDAKCAYVMTHRECLFVPTDDVEEHLGIEVIYRYEKE